MNTLHIDCSARAESHSRRLSAAIVERPVLIGIASGGVFAGERATQPDFLTPYLSAALGCAGLSMPHFLPLQATASLSPEQVASAQHALLATIDAARIGKGCETLRRFAAPALDFS